MTQIDPPPSRRRSAPPPPERPCPDAALDPAQAATLRRCVERILPSDDGPGAREAGCPDYVEQAVRRRLTADSQLRMRRGLAFVDRLATQLFDRSFRDLDDPECDRALREVQRMPHPTAQAFFHHLVFWTLEAFLSDPRHGGNVDAIGWRSLDLPMGDRSAEDPRCTTS